MSSLPPELILPPLTISGHGAVNNLLGACAEFGARGILVHGASLRSSGTLRSILERKPGHIRVEPVQQAGGEPTLAQVESLRKTARDMKVDWIAAVGGGSVMDAAKAAAGLLSAPLSLLEYHDGAAIPPATTPFVAVPTTAGTGSEATVVAVLTNTCTGVKKSIRHASFLPRKVILDPELLRSCPRAVLAASGMDAFTQAVESFLSLHGTWLTGELALKAAVLVRNALPAMAAGYSPEAAACLLEGSYMAGLALSNARLGLVHGLAHPLGARYGVAHGRVCAACLLPVLEFNRPAAEDRFRALHNALSEDVGAVAMQLMRELHMESPFRGLALSDLPGIVEETLASGSTRANPRKVSAADVERIVKELFAA
jgi:alcohol dehydrogenase class IV